MARNGACPMLTPPVKMKIEVVPIKERMKRIKTLLERNRSGRNSIQGPFGPARSGEVAHVIKPIGVIAAEKTMGRDRDARERPHSTWAVCIARTAVTGSKRIWMNPG